MGNLGNKQIMANNIRRHMQSAGVTATDVCSVLRIPMPTFSDWINARTYPRIDKIEMLANYFGISKADLVEEQSSASESEHLIENPDIRMIARAGQKMTPEQAENLRKYAQFMFPEAFEE